MSRMTIAVLTTALLAIAAIGGFFWWQHRPEPQMGQPPEATAPAVEPAASAPQEAETHFPIPEPTQPQALPALDKSDSQVTAALNALLGQKPVLTFVQSDGFIRRVVATVDGLGRAHSAPRLWPVNPTGGRFSVSGAGEATVIGNDNSLRYAPLLNLVETVNMRHAAAIYIKFYPLFQKAYEELGFPGKYFNDRLVAVIDQLLATPEPVGPVRVQLTEVKGPTKQVQPWVHYEFGDPQLEQLSSGQKILVRMGSVNERRAKAKLRELRVAVTSAAEEIKANASPASTPR